MFALSLTPVQQDYVELISRLSAEAKGGVRVSDIASEFGIKPPTVVRTLARLRKMGLVAQEERGLVNLTVSGHVMAEQLIHRHNDIFEFLIQVLGVDYAQAESDACILEHGFSAESSTRLHLFLEHFKNLPTPVKAQLRIKPDDSNHFDTVGDSVGPGLRG